MEYRHFMIIRRCPIRNDVSRHRFVVLATEQYNRRSLRFSQLNPPPTTPWGIIHCKKKGVNYLATPN